MIKIENDAMLRAPLEQDIAEKHGMACLGTPYNTGQLGTELNRWTGATWAEFSTCNRALTRAASERVAKLHLYSEPFSSSHPAAASAAQVHFWRRHKSMGLFSSAARVASLASPVLRPLAEQALTCSIQSAVLIGSAACASPLVCCSA
eukprot:9179908-Pyramimonas_sp.AAC.1